MKAHPKPFLYMFGGEGNPPDAAERRREEELARLAKEAAAQAGDEEKPEHKKEESSGASGRARKITKSATVRRDMADFFRYDVNSGSWEQLAVDGGKDARGKNCTVPSARRGHSATFVPGDVPSRARLLREGIGGPGTGTRNAGDKSIGGRHGSIWLYGGCGPDRARGDQAVFNDIFVMDLSTGVWCPAYLDGEPLPPRGGHSATLVRHRIIVVGGVGSTPDTFFPSKDMMQNATRSSIRQPRRSTKVGPGGRRQSRRMSRYEQTQALASEWIYDHAPRVLAIDTQGLFAVNVKLPYDDPEFPLPGSDDPMPWPRGAPAWVYGHTAVASPTEKSELLIFGGRPGIPERPANNQVWVLHIDKFLREDGFGREAKHAFDLRKKEPHSASASAGFTADEVTGNWLRPLQVAGHQPSARCGHAMELVPSAPDGSPSNTILVYGGLNLPVSIAAGGIVTSFPKKATTDDPLTSGFECDQGQASTAIYVLKMRDNKARKDSTKDSDTLEQEWVESMQHELIEGHSQLKENTKAMADVGDHVTKLGKEGFAHVEAVRAAQVLPVVARVRPPPVVSPVARSCLRPGTSPTASRTGGRRAHSRSARTGSGMTTSPSGVRAGARAQVKQMMVVSTARDTTGPPEATRTLSDHLRAERQLQLRHTLHTPANESTFAAKLVRKKMIAQLNASLHGDMQDASYLQAQEAAAKAAELQKHLESQASMEQHHEASMDLEESRGAVATVTRGGYDEWFAKTRHSIYSHSNVLNAQAQRNVLKQQEMRLASEARKMALQETLASHAAAMPARPQALAPAPAQTPHEAGDDTRASNHLPDGALQPTPSQRMRARVLASEPGSDAKSGGNVESSLPQQGARLLASALGTAGAARPLTVQGTARQSPSQPRAAGGLAEHHREKVSLTKREQRRLQRTA